MRADVDLVSIYFTVRDRRERLVTDLTKDAIKVVEDGKPQQISFFAHHSDVPINAGVLLDTSTVMARTLRLEADAASRFFQTAMRPNDQGFLVSYASHIEVLQVPIEDAGQLANKAPDIRKNARYRALVVVAVSVLASACSCYTCLFRDWRRVVPFLSIPVSANLS